MTIQLHEIQSAIQAANFSGWLLYDFRGCNPLARRVLKFKEGGLQSRRWFYFIPAKGEPTKLVHAIEADALDHLPGQKIRYMTRHELKDDLTHILQGCTTVAAEYAPMGNNPYISRLDGGTCELITSTGAKLASSGDLIQLFETVMDESQLQMHLDVSKITDAAFYVAWDFIQHQVSTHGFVEELAVQDVILKYFADNNCYTYSPPIVARNANAGYPHYETGHGTDTKIRKGDFLLIDLWAKLNQPRAIYSDLSRMAYLGDAAPELYVNLFKIVTAARDASLNLARSRFANNQPLYGWEMDQAARKVINDAGYGKFFIHRTGHSLGQEVHGNGAHLDDFETHEERRILPRTLFTIEPGIYNPEENYGLRTEINVYITQDNQVQPTGGMVQTEIQLINI